MAFCSDAVALLGIALATQSLPAELRDRVKSWMTLFLESSFGMRGLLPWQRCFLAVTQRCLGTAPELPLPMEPDVADVRLAFRAKGLLPEDVADAADEEHAVALLKSSFGSSPSPVRAAIGLAALGWLARSSPVLIPGRVTIATVSNMLNAVPAALLKWTWEQKPRTRNGVARKWYLDHEYHVQNLLYTILRPVFPDVTAEEYTALVGPSQPRADLGIPSMRLIVEVKFWRAETPAAKMLEQIAADNSLYLAAGSQYSHLLPFIWDDAGRTDEHSSLIRGLRGLTGVSDAVIVSRPARFTDNAPPA